MPSAKISDGKGVRESLGFVAVKVKRAKAVRASRRLPQSVERELAKLLGTLGFHDYGSALWNLTLRTADGPPRASAPAIPLTVSSQILDQARHDPAVASVGVQSVAFLSRRRMSAFDQHKINASSLFGNLSERVQIVLVLPNIARFEKVAALVAAWKSLGAQSFAIVVTDENESGVESAAKPYRERSPRDRIIFWRDHRADYDGNSARLFALFLHALGPAIVLVDQSELGLETIVRYGRALKRFHRFFCTFETGKFDAEPPAFARFLRAASAHAAIVAEHDAAASVLKRYSADPEGPGLVVCVPQTAAGDDGRAKDIAGIFGDFADGRSTRARSALTRLLKGQAWSRGDTGPLVSPLAQAGDGDAPAIDVTVAIVFHRERELAVAALASLADMVRIARGDGLAVEVLAMLDRPDEATRAIVTTHCAGIADVEVVDFGDLGLVRNAAADKARGRFCAFLDGDDLWGPRWLAASYRAAAEPSAPPSAIWHPSNIYLFYERDFEFHTSSTEPSAAARSEHFMHRSSLDPDFDLRDALLENPWSANAFAATEVFRNFRYLPNDWFWQSGIEDWRWNLETLGAGISHLTVPDTVHIIRVKEIGSLGAQSDARGLLPILV